MINRRIRFQDNLFLAMLLILLAACFGYFCVRKPFCAKLATLQRQQAAIEDELELQRYMAQRKETMEDQMNQEPGKGNGQLGTYQNMTNEINQLGQILSAATSYDLDMLPEEVSEDIVRREIAISCQTDSYGQAWDILKAIEDGEYRCIIEDVELIRKVDEAGETEGGESVFVNVLVTYFEVADGEEAWEGQERTGKEQEEDSSF